MSFLSYCVEHKVVLWVKFVFVYSDVFRGCREDGNICFIFILGSPVCKAPNSNICSYCIILTQIVGVAAGGLLRIAERGTTKYQ